ncbi:MAG: DUF2341 domain-containing protein, partial [Candidatus Thorarchaeota archaeon]
MRERYQKSVVFLLFVCFIGSTLFFVPTISAAGESWLSGWDYRRRIDINGSVGAGTNYPMQLTLYYDEKIEVGNVSAWANRANQGIAVDYNYVWTTNNSGITKYDRDTMTVVDSRDTSGDGTYGTYIGDLSLGSGDWLYVVSHSSSGPYDTMIMRYNKNDLTFDTEYNITTSSPELATSVSYNGSHFWVMRGANQRPSRTTCLELYDSTFNGTGLLGNFTLSYNVTGPYWGYEGVDWYDDYIIVNTHEGNQPSYFDVYQWNSTGFEERFRLEPSRWAGVGWSGRAIGSQGISIENERGDWYLWTGSRGNPAGEDEDIGRTELIISDFDTDEVTLQGLCNEDFSDIRFTGSDGETELSYYIETQVDGSYASIWFNVSESLESDGSVYLYYGNSGASTSSDGDGVFIEFADFEEGNLNDLNWSQNDVAVSTTYARTGTYSMRCNITGASAGGWEFTGGVVQTITAFGGWFYDWGLDVTGSDAILREWGSGVSDKVGAGIVYTGDTWAETNMTFHETGYVYEDADMFRYLGWHKVEFVLSGTSSGYLVVLIDGNMVLNTTKPSDMEYFYGICRNGAPATMDSFFDDMYVRKGIAQPPVIASINAEEFREWIQIDEATLIFPVGWDPTFQFGYDAFFIFLGLIMIPTSTMYLVRGGRKEASMDK